MSRRSIHLPGAAPSSTERNRRRRDVIRATGRIVHAAVGAEAAAALAVLIARHGSQRAALEAALIMAATEVASPGGGA